MTAKYDHIGQGYNRTRKADPYLTERLISLLKPESGKYYLDVGCGTGNYTHALYNRGVHLTGIDPSEKMLTEARKKNNSIEWKKGSVEDLPFHDAVFNGAIATLTLHHWQNMVNGFAEIKRVLIPRSNLVIFTSSPEQMETYWLNHYFPQMMKTSTAQMPSLKKISACLEQSGFSQITTEKYFVQNDLQDLFLQSGKYKPAMYFDPQIRSGISSFAALSNAEEVQKGLDLLARDIESGKIQQIIDQYENQAGDYLFIRACS